MVLEFPQDALLGNVYETLAYLSLQQAPKDYRMAAHYLGKMRDATIDSAEKISLMMKIGNAFYLGGAFDIAAQMYCEVLKSDLPAIPYDRILCQLIQANLKSEDFSAAEQNLQNFRQNHNFTTTYRWQSELLYANALVESGNPDRATDYLSVLLDLYASQIQSLYSIKFYLLQAHTMFTRQNFQRANLLASNICKIFPSRSSSAEIAQITSKALFIKGACEYKLKNARDGSETFRILRSEYQDSELALLAYFEEAEFFFRSGDPAAACAVLAKCIEADCPYSPFAYYRCAEYCRSMGIVKYDTAIAYLSELILKYGDHEIAYAARMEIADMFRLSGRFSDAQLVYEELLKHFPFDERYHFTELCLAKAIFAQRSKGESFANQAKAILERLHLLGSIERHLRLEIAATYCFVLQISGDLEEMKKVAWATLLANVSSDRKIFRERQSSGDYKLSSGDAYWLLQIANLLSDCYLSDGDCAESKALAEIRALLSQ
jgi:tetratricopeptide (TPR) repeat protein